MNICNAVGKMMQDEVENMTYLSYKRDNESLRVSQNSICQLMRVEIVYDNPLLNHRGFIGYLKSKDQRVLCRGVLNC